MLEGKFMRINRGEIWSVAWTGQAQKPRPAEDSFICLDKLMAIPLANLGKCHGKVADEVMKEVNARLIKILGIE
jgi:mRNA-degrading endonuclease toxin of MazEF toxin-antitoxin module